MCAVASYRLGRVEEGLQWGARAVELDPVDAGVRYNVACLYAVAGRPDEAVRYIEDAVQAGFGAREWLERDPTRQHPRTAAFPRAIGLDSRRGLPGPGPDAPAPRSPCRALPVTPSS
jgi:hypothetical protein